MATTKVLQPNSGEKIHILLLLLCLAGPQIILSANGESSTGGLTCTITGPDYVTVGVPSFVVCTSHCSTCTYSMSLEGQSAHGQGNELAFTVRSWVESLTVTCTATDDTTMQTVTATKQLQVLSGPDNITIVGSDLMTAAASHTYSCHASCRPSCTYSWKRDTGTWISGQGNVISITPQEEEEEDTNTLTCKATNTVSGMFIFETRFIDVTSGPSEIQIRGPDIIDLAAKTQFECTAQCHPSCRYTSSVGSQTVRGNIFELTVDRPIKSVTVKCEAQNTASRKTATAVKTVRLKDHNRSRATRPEETSAVLLLLAFITSVVLLL